MLSFNPNFQSPLNTQSQQTTFDLLNDAFAKNRLPLVPTDESKIANSNSLLRPRTDIQLFNSALAKGYEKLTESLQPQLSPKEFNRYSLQPSDKISAEEASSNILGFIRKRILSDQASSVSTEELNQRLEQAREGFIQGFNEAKDIIEGLGLLSESLAEELQNTFDKVLNGINEISEQINQAQSPEIATSQLVFNAESQSSQNFSLNLITQDGDTVSVIFNQQTNANTQLAYQSIDDKQNINFEQTTQSSQLFNLTINGNLDEEEQAAINALFDDISVLAQDFYAGNLDAAFNQAQKLTLNTKELASLALNLQQSTTLTAVAAYQSVFNQPNESQSNSAKLSPSNGQNINGLLNSFNRLFNNAQKFQSPKQLIKDITQQIDQAFIQNGLTKLSREDGVERFYPEFLKVLDG